jgi:uncharacterized protein (DUF1778 family)
MRSTAERSHVRLSCRVSAKIKGRAEEAASILGLSITDFTEAALADKAQAVIEQNERISLSQRDFEAFVRAIEEPAEPTPKLREELERYGKLKREQPESNL